MWKIRKRNNVPSKSASNNRCKVRKVINIVVQKWSSAPVEDQKRETTYHPKVVRSIGARSYKVVNIVVKKWSVAPVEGQKIETHYHPKVLPVEVLINRQHRLPKMACSLGGKVNSCQKWSVASGGNSEKQPRLTSTSGP